MYPWEFWLRVSLYWWQGTGLRAEQVANVRPDQTVIRPLANVIWVDFRHARRCSRTLRTAR